MPTRDDVDGARSVEKDEAMTRMQARNARRWCAIVFLVGVGSIALPAVEASAQTGCIDSPRWAPQTDGPLEFLVCRDATGSLQILDSRAASGGGGGGSSSGGGGGSSTSGGGRPAISAAQREENRRLQTALAGLGCDPGTPDGVFGRRTRAAIRCLQELIDAPETGALDDAQRATLLAVYDVVYDDGAELREDPTPEDVLAIYQNGGEIPETPVVGADPFEDAPNTSVSISERGGDADVGSVEEMPATDVAAIDGLPDAQTVTDETGVGDLVDALFPDGDDAVPDLGDDAADASERDADEETVAVFCGRTHVNPSAARFCEMREGYVADAGQMNSDFGRSFEAAAETCAGLRERLGPVLAALDAMSIEEVRAEVRAQVTYDEDRRDALMSSMAICVGSGYAVDDGALALAAALALDALGDEDAAALIGHHLEFGLATPPETERAALWLEIAPN